MNHDTPSRSKLYLSETEAADRYSLSTSWFQKRRWLDDYGPPFNKVGSRVLYPIIECDAWFESHRRHASKSDHERS